MVSALEMFPQKKQLCMLALFSPEKGTLRSATAEVLEMGAA